MKSIISPRIGAILFAMALAVAPAFADDASKYKTTDNPRSYVEALLGRTKTEGMEPLKEFTEAMGIKSPQYDAAFSTLDSAMTKSEKNSVKIIEETDTGGVLRQVYAYSYYGTNAWLFWRFDFSRTGDEWTVNQFNFNSEYQQVIAPTFMTAKVVQTP